MPGQTLSQIRRLLADAGIRPRRRLGQHFLIDLNLMRKVVRTAKVSPQDVVLEVGAGTGSLTELLLDTGCRVLAVEMDRRLAALLRQRLGAHESLTLIEADALAGKNRLDPGVLEALAAVEPESGGARKLVANLPYQIATPLLMELLINSNLEGCPARLTSITCTIQKEVADRLNADVGTHAYGPASILTRLLARLRIVARIPPTAFWPRPQVESALITLTPLEPGGAGIPARTQVDDATAFARFVRDAFTHRRKKLKHALRFVLDAQTGRDARPTLDDAQAGRDARPTAEDVLDACGISPDLRPDCVAPPDWLRLFRQSRPAPGE